MKKIIALLLAMVLAISLAACGEEDTGTPDAPDTPGAEESGETTRQTPPELTVTGAQGASITAMGGSYDWHYEQNGQSYSAIACGAHPLDEILKDKTPDLGVLGWSGQSEVTLTFSDCAPDSVSVRCWEADAWGETYAQPETVTAQKMEDGTFTAYLPWSDGIFAVDALWDGEPTGKNAAYTFCAHREEADPAYVSNLFGVETAGIRRVEIDWLGGCVRIVPVNDAQTISFSEMAYQDTAEEQRLSYTVDGDTLKIDFCRGGHVLSSLPEKLLLVCLPSALALEELEVSTTGAQVDVSDVNTRSAKIDTVSGGVQLGGTADEVGIDSVSGGATVTADCGKLDFSAVSGGLTARLQRICEVEADTTSGDVALSLPAAEYGFTLDYDTVSGKLELGFNADGGDGRWTYGSGVNRLEISTVSGSLTVD